MILKIKFLLLFFLIIPVSLFSESGRLIKGIIIDEENGSLISGARVSIVGTNSGTYSSSFGKFRLNIPLDKNLIRISSIGYKSIEQSISKSIDSIIIKLVSNPVTTGTVEVTAAISPEQIIQRAIERKKDNIFKIHTFSGNLYSKLVFEAGGSLVSSTNVKSGSVSISAGFGGGDDSTNKNQAFLLETFSRNYNDYDKNINQSTIFQRRQTSNVPADQNLLTIGNFISFYDDEIDLINTKFVTPLADKALSYYNFKLIKREMLDKKYIYVLEVNPSTRIFPSFTGIIKIVEGEYNIIEADLKPGDNSSIPFVDSLQIRQKYNESEEKLWYPAYLDIKGKVKVDVIKGLIDMKLYMSATSIYNDVEINKLLPDSVYQLDKKSVYKSSERKIVNVEPSADSLDLSFWDNNSLREITPKELELYKITDTTKKADTAKSEPSSSGFTRVPYLDFNRVGSISLGINFGIKISSLNTYYIPYYSIGQNSWYGSSGFNIDLFKPLKFSGEIYSTIAETGFNKNYSRFLNTISSALAGWDYYDYMQSDGFGFKLNSDISNINIEAGANFERNFSLLKTTDRSIFQNYKRRNNPAVDEGNFNKYHLNIKYGDLGFLIQTSKFDFEIAVNANLIQKDDISYPSINAKGIVSIPTFFTGYNPMMLYLCADGGIADENSPLQYQFRMSDRLFIINRFGNFYSTKVSEFGGSRYFLFHGNFNFTDIWWRYLGLPTFEGRGLDLIAGGSFAKYYSGNRNTYRDTGDDYYGEAGFGLSRIPTFFSNVIFLSFDFRWGIGPIGSGRFGWSLSGTLPF
jgi:hypothetical protein